MEFSKDSGNLLRIIIPKWRKNRKIKNKENEKKLNNLLIKIYSEIETSDLYVKKDMNKECFKILSKPDIKIPEYYKSKWVPYSIQKYIEEEGKYMLEFKCMLDGRKIEIYFMLYDSDEVLKIESEYYEYIRYIYTWLRICYSFSSKNINSSLSIYIYLTPNKKELPELSSEVLGVDNVNSGFSYVCREKGEIIIYRKEEWRKVFIHETFHSFCFDVNGRGVIEIEKDLRKIYNVNILPNISETYSEFWARVLNCCFFSFDKSKLNNRKERLNNFLLYSNFCLEMERIYSFYQVSKILSFMGLTYKSLIEKQSEHFIKKIYKEDTHVLSYYVLVCVLFNNYENFLLWCDENNPDFFKFNNNNNIVTVKKLLEYINKEYDTKDLIYSINNIGIIKEKGMQMSIVS